MTIIKLKFIDSLSDKKKKKENIVEIIVTKMTIFEF
jgi:hypothetical protein